MHQTCTRLLLNSSVDLLWVIKLRLLKIKFNQENCQQKDTPLILKQMSRRMIDSPRCCFIPFIGWKFDASMHTSVWCIGEINRWIKQRSRPQSMYEALKLFIAVYSTNTIKLNVTKRNEQIQKGPRPTAQKCLGTEGSRRACRCPSSDLCLISLPWSLHANLGTPLIPETNTVQLD